MAHTARTALSVLVLVIAALTHVATSRDIDEDWRYPCDGQEDWDHADPVYLHFAYEWEIDPHIPGLLDGVILMDGDRQHVQLVVATHEGGLVSYCPVGGLEPDTEYTWEVGPFHESHNHVQPPRWFAERPSSFTTGSNWPENPVTSTTDCEKLSLHADIQALEFWNEDPCFIDTGDR